MTFEGLIIGLIQKRRVRENDKWKIGKLFDMAIPKRLTSYETFKIFIRVGTQRSKFRLIDSFFILKQINLISFRV